MATLWQCSFEMPLVADVHTVIHAFLRTSEWGGWEVDPAGDRVSGVMGMS